jgi:hypothetical protein
MNPTVERVNLTALLSLNNYNLYHYLVIEKVIKRCISAIIL